MPFTNGKYYMNPAYGQAMERARVRGKAGIKSLVPHHDNSERDTDDWVWNSSRDLLPLG